MEENKHWASELEPGDTCFATIRHQTDGSKNIKNARVTVVANYPKQETITGVYESKNFIISYSDLTPYNFGFELSQNTTIEERWKIYKFIKTKGKSNHDDTGDLTLKGKMLKARILSKPKVVCYCGSLRFKEKFQELEYQSLMKGEIALLPCCMYVDIEREYGVTSDFKQKADENHTRKIDISDEVFIVNINGYIGQSTQSEINYAHSIGKPVKYLEPITTSTCGNAMHLPDEIKNKINHDIDEFEAKKATQPCPEFPFFGASYPDAHCIDGHLWDLDKVDENGNFYADEEHPPCPFCNTEKFINEYLLDFLCETVEECEKYVNRLKAKYQKQAKQ